MLRELTQLGSASVSISTSSNGQINLAIFSENKPPLSMTFEVSNLHLAEQEISNYCNAVNTPVSSIAVGEVVNGTPEKTSAKKQKNNETTLAKTAISENKVLTQTPQPTTEQSVEDDILATFGL